MKTLSLCCKLLLLVLWCIIPVMVYAQGHPRYLLTPDEAEHLLKQQLGLHEDVTCRVMPSFDELAFEGDRYRFSTLDGTQEWIVDACTGEVFSYPKIPKTAQPAQVGAKLTADEARRLAELHTATFLRQHMPDYPHHVFEMATVGSSTLYFSEKLAGGCYNTNYEVTVHFDRDTGDLHTVIMRYLGEPLTISLVPAITRTQAQSILLTALKPKTGARWLHEEPVTDIFPENQWSFLLITDKLGVQRLVYRFHLIYCATMQFPTWQAYSDYLDTHGDPLLAGTTEIYVDVDAQDSELLAVDPTTADDAAFWSTIKVYVDKKPAVMSYMPRWLDGEPYIPLLYLNKTKLWPGTVTDTGNGTWDVAYGENHATLSPTETTVSGKNGVIMTGKPPIIYKGKPYLHYRAVAALTGDTCTWDATHLRLDIRTIPVPDPAAKAVAIPPPPVSPAALLHLPRETALLPGTIRTAATGHPGMTRDESDENVIMLLAIIRSGALVEEI